MAGAAAAATAAAFRWAAASEGWIVGSAVGVGEAGCDDALEAVVRILLAVAPSPAGARLTICTRILRFPSLRGGRRPTDP